MIDIRLEIVKDIFIIVKGSFRKGSIEDNLPDAFLIFGISLEDEDSDLVDIFEWVNSKKKGTILSEIEQMCLEKLT